MVGGLVIGSPCADLGVPNTSRVPSTEVQYKSCRYCGPLLSVSANVHLPVTSFGSKFLFRFWGGVHSTRVGCEGLLKMKRSPLATFGDLS